MTEESGIVLTLDDPASSKTRALKDIFAGTIGGIAQVLVGQPFDTTKVRLQSLPPGSNLTTMNVIKDLIKNEGIFAFYKGTLTPLVGIGACVSIQFGVNEFMKRFFTKINDGENKMNSLQFLIAGGAGGFCNGFLASPIENIRIKLQIQKKSEGNLKEFNGPLDVFKKMYNRGGLKLVMRGLVPTLWRESLGIGVYFMTFEALVKRDMDNRKMKRNEIESWKLCIFGGLAGYAMWFTVYPIDIIKSNLQTDDYKNLKFKNSINVVRYLYGNFGIGGFFKGFTPTILRAAPANAATFVAFEQAMRLLG